MKKNQVCVLTIGTRDVQIPKDIISNFLQFSYLDETNRVKSGLILKNREFGKLALEALDEELVSLDEFIFPMASAFIAYCKQNHIEEPQFILIGTDQLETENNELFRAQDTLYMAEIVGRYVKRQLPGCDIVLLNASGNIHNQQEMYVFFKGIFSNSHKPLYPKQNTTYTLMFQGGLDQINTSLLLLAIEHYQDAVFLGKLEGQEHAYPLLFPQTFKNELLAKNIKALLDSYQFFAVSKLLPAGSTENLLANYAHARISLDHESARQIWGSLSNRNTEHRNAIEPILSKIQLINNPTAKAESKVLDIYLSAKIAYHTGDHTSMLLRLYMLLENFFQYYLMDVFGNLDDYYSAESQYNQSKNEAWLTALADHEGLYEAIKKGIKGLNKDVKKVDINPTVYSAKFIFEYFVNNNCITGPHSNLAQLNNIFSALDQLRVIRNDISHEGKSVSVKEINARLRQSKRHNITKIDDLFIALDVFLHVTDLGHFTHLKNQILLMV